jgi:hypothetical protein
LNGRQFLDVALLVPGVSPTNVASTQLFPETSAVPGASLSVASQRNLSNNFIVDGLSANDDAAGLSGITYGVDNVTNHKNVLTKNANFGAGAYPSSPSATFGDILAVGEPRTLQFGLRTRF